MEAGGQPARTSGGQWHKSAASTLTVPAMAKKADKQQASALDEVRRHVRIFVDLGRVASESTDEDGFLDQVVVQVARAVEIDHVKVLRYRRREADLLIAAGFGWKEGVVRSATLSADLRSPPGRSFQTAQPVVIKNFQAQDDFIHSGLLQDHGIVSLVNVPVLIEGAAWGVLEVDSTRPRDFSQDTIEFLTATAALIGAAATVLDGRARRFSVFLDGFPRPRPSYLPRAGSSLANTGARQKRRGLGTFAFTRASCPQGRRVNMMGGKR